MLSENIFLTGHVNLLKIVIENVRQLFYVSYISAAVDVLISFLVGGCRDLEPLIRSGRSLLHFLHITFEVV